MRIIDADEVVKFYKNMGKEFPELSVGTHFSIADIISNLDNIPTIPTYNPWISIRDHEPPKGRPLILFSRTYVDDQPAESFFIGEYRGDQFMANTLRAIPKCEIAYWMLLPETPEE